MVELLIACGVAALVLGITMVLLIASAKENRRGLADASVEQAASDLQGRIMYYLREMSASEGVVFSNPTTNGAGLVIGYKNIIVAQGPAPEQARQEIIFDSSQGKVTYNPNRASTNPPVVLIKTNAFQTLRLLAFSPSIKPDGRADNSLVNVFLRMDDNRFSRRTGNNPADVYRTFAVKMRNN